MIFEEILERMLNLYTKGIFADEILKAKVEFFERSIPSLEDDSSHFNLRMSQFLDWYLFTRKLNDIGLTPVEYGLQDREFPRKENDKKLFKALLNADHSLFEFSKIKNQDIFIKDTLTGKKITVKNSDVTAGFREEELFSVRVIPYEDSYVFARGFCFHPSEATKYLLKEAALNKKITEDKKEKLLLKFTRMKYKVDQYKHIQPKFIYTNEPAFRA